MATTWNPIVAGVDASLEGATAATLACAVARTAKASCHLVHAVRDQAAETAGLVREVLLGSVPASLLDRLDVRVGRPAAVLSQVAAQYGAESIVVGGKHHSALGRWLAGGTVHDLLRTWKADLLVVGSHGKGFVNRLLLGSTTQRLADDLPTSVLVVPGVVPARRAERAADWAAQMAHA